MAVDKTKNKQVLVTFPNELLEKITEYWHENQIPNRNEAIRELIIEALEKEVLEKEEKSG
ncbi:ribbon-helix-helix domain-containing protein [Bacillus sp. 2205SS5-2]|uniref:ribbon-helix-helix domain-containing protein n=1 Tax=Bacillus sp. 2205SS5-2 TaxID=3109031 RepID=UPI003004C93B